LISDLLQVVGALAILIPFVLLQMKRVDPNSTAYLLPNLGGSIVLAVLAAVGRDWGFLLLEVAWALTAAWSLVATAKRGETAAG
jgi:hypothetical protein